MKQQVYTAIYETDEDGGYVVSVPSLPGCYSQGDTIEEAEQNITEAVGLYLETLRDEHKALPVEHPLARPYSSRHSTIVMPDPLPVLPPRKVVKALKKCGFEEVRQKGSHLVLFNVSTGRRVVIPMHSNKDIKRNLLRKIILIEAEMTIDSFLELL